MSGLLEHQYLSFGLAGGRYAIPVGSVREVLACVSVTSLPGMAPYMRGLIDLRGRAVPVLDLRLRFGMAGVEIGVGSAVVVVEPRASTGGRVFGLLADTVHEVVEIGDGELEEPPRMGAGESAGFVKGVARREGAFVLLIDLDSVFEKNGAGSEPDGPAMCAGDPV